MTRTSWILVAVALAAGLSMGWAHVFPPKPRPLPALTVEVLNGCGEDQLASRTATALRALGQDVVHVGEAEHHDFARSLLIDRRGKPQLTRRLAQEIGPIQVVLEQLEDPKADVTLILGQDSAQLQVVRATVP